MKIRVSRKKKTETTNEIVLTGEQLRILLCEQGIEIPITVQIPGGGDWSDRPLDIDTTTPIQIRWSS